MQTSSYSDTTKILVGIVILNYNRAKLTIDCVNSIKYQSHTNYKIIVVDNDSPETNQKEILKTELSQDVILILNPKNGGYAAGNNVGARYCSDVLNTDFVFILNNDTILDDKNTIKELLSVFNHNQRISAVSPLTGVTSNINVVNNETQVRRLVRPSDFIICNISLLSKLPFFKYKVDHYLYADIMPFEKRTYEVDTINGAAFMIPNSILKEINYLDESTFLYGEEFILGLKLKKLNKVCAITGNIVLKHLQGQSTGHNSTSTSWVMHNHYIDSVSLILDKYYGVHKSLIYTFRFLRYFDFIAKKIVDKWKVLISG